MIVEEREQKAFAFIRQRRDATRRACDFKSRRFERPTRRYIAVGD